MKKAIIERLKQGPAQFTEWATNPNPNHGNRKVARNAITELEKSGQVRRIFIGRFPYYILNTHEGLMQALRMQIDENTKPSPCGCLHWTGWIDPVRGPAVRPDGSGDTMPSSVRRVIWSMNKGPIDKDATIKMRCGDEACVSFAHMYSHRRNTHMKGRAKSVAVRARIADGQRRIHKISIEDARQIRASNESAKVLAARYGCTTSNIYLIKAGKTVREYQATPFQGLVKTAANEQGRKRA